LSSPPPDTRAARLEAALPGAANHPLFDPQFYLLRYREVREAGIDPFIHYVVEGEALGHRPNPLFHTAWYKEQHPEADSPLAHFIARSRQPHGKGHDTQPRAQPWPNPLFDPDWYRERHQLAADVDALAHFLETGSALGLAPHPLFDTAGYLDRHPDVGANAENPLAHFLDCGAAAGYAPHPLFDPAFYIERYRLERDENPLVHYLEEGANQGNKPHPFFDGAWYASRYPNVGASGVNPLIHYSEIGIFEDRQPNPLFDPVWYREQHPDLATSGQAPLLHFIEHGHAANPCFEAYQGLFCNADNPLPACERIEEDDDNPLRDYIARGFTCPSDESDALAFACHAAPSVSIVIPVFDQLPHTMACLRSLAAARGAVSFEVIIADDASQTINYQTVLADVPGVRVVRAERNRGFVRGCNAAAGVARGRFVVFLNNDTVVRDAWLDALVATFDRFSQVGIVGSKTIFPNGRVAEAGAIVWRDGTAWNFGRQRVPVDPEVDYARDADYVSGSALMIERALFRELGGFDERFCPAYYEDTDLAFRVREAGRRVLYQPASEVIHFEGTSQGTSVTRDIKSHQLVNQRVFHDRWRDVLAGHGEPGVEPDREKDRTIVGQALVIDVCTPSSTRDARSQRLLSILLALRDAGYRVTFVPENGDASEPFGGQLRSHGVRVLAPPDREGIEPWLAREGKHFDVCLTGRPATAQRLIQALKRNCPKARLILDGTDLLAPEIAAQLLGERVAAKPVALAPMFELADATLVAASFDDTGHAAEPGVYRLPQICSTASNAPGFDERRDVFVVTGLQGPPCVDALLWLRDEIIPGLPEPLAGIRFFLRESALIRGLAVESERLIPLPEQALTDANALDRFRLALSINRFGASLVGPTQSVLARGLPVVATSHAAANLPASFDGAITLADTTPRLIAAVADLYGEPDRWGVACETALDASERLFSFPRARALLQELSSGPMHA